MNQLARPSIYKAYHEIELVCHSKNKKQEIVANFCGNICESGDILGEERLVNLPEVGDAVLVHNAGTYGFAMASNYTGRLRPAEIMLENDDVRLIRKRETLSSLMENIIFN